MVKMKEGEFRVQPEIINQFLTSTRTSKQNAWPSGSPGSPGSSQGPDHFSRAGPQTTDVLTNDALSEVTHHFKRAFHQKTAICPMSKTSLIGLSGSGLAGCFL